MEPFIKWYIRAHFLSALSAITLQGLIFKSVFPNYELPDIVYFILTASATYYIIYRILVLCYEKWVWKWLLKEYNIDGTWYHEFKSAEFPDYCRVGCTLIKQEALSIHINAINYNKDFDISFRTLWNETAITINKKRRLVISYVAHTYTYGYPPSFTKPPEKTGVIYVTIILGKGKKPIRMDGIFHDSSPPFRRGTATWWREVEWQNKLKEITSTVGKNSCI